MRFATGLAIAGLAMAMLATPGSTAGTDGPGSDHSAAEEVELQVGNHSFEEPVSGDGDIPGWEGLWLREEIRVEVSDARASHGEHSLHFVDETDSHGGAVVSEPIEVQAGSPHRLRADLFVESGTINSTLYLLDPSGERIGTTPIGWAAEPGEWVTVEHTAMIPDGVASVELVFDSGATNTAGVFIDDVRFTQLPRLGTERSFGEPMTAVSSNSAGYTTDSTGRSLGVLITRGEPSVASVVDINTGELVVSEPFPDVAQVWSYITTEDRTVYIGSSSAGLVYRFDPDALTFEEVAQRPFDQTHLWSTGLTPDGTILYGTYPDGKLLSFDPASDEWHDHGTVVEGNGYVRSLAVEDDSTVYVGTGPTAVLARVDLQTDEVEILDVPTGAEDQEFVYDLDIRGGLLFARYSPGDTLHMMDLDTGEWVDTHEQPTLGLSVSPVFQRSGDPEAPREVIIPRGIDAGSIAYDIDTGETAQICFDSDGGSARGWNQVPIPIAGMSDDVLVTATADGTFYAYDPQSDSCAELPTEGAGAAVRIRSVEVGADGGVYSGASASSLARTDPASGESETLPSSGTTMQLHQHGDLMVAGTYTGAGIAFYDITQPPEQGVNPTPPVQISDGQDRTVAMTSVDDLVAVGTVPTPSNLGGVLGLIDPRTQDLRIYPDIVEDQSIISLASIDGLIYGGTGITGGLGVEPTQSEGRLFIFDPASGEVVFETVPVPGDGHVAGLTLDPDGNIWGMTRNAVFRFDRQEREVTALERYTDRDDSGSYFVGRNIEWADDRLVVVTNDTLFEVDPQTLERTILLEEPGLNMLSVDDEGHRYYYAREGELLEWTRDAVCDEGGQCADLAD